MEAVGQNRGFLRGDKHSKGDIGTWAPYILFSLLSLGS